jgi:hypothetical protein
MKRVAFALVMLGSSVVATVGTANAVEFDVGPSGAYVGPHRNHWRDHEWRRAYGYYGNNCRIVVREHWNRWGERVTTRTRVCN